MRRHTRSSMPQVIPLEQPIPSLEPIDRLGLAGIRIDSSVPGLSGRRTESLRDVRGLITTVLEENRAFDKTGQPSGAKAPVATRYVYDPLKQIT